MYQRYSTKEQRFNKRFPLSIVAILAVVQMLTSFAIVALEIGHTLLHMQLTNLFAGFWTAIPFTVLWISMFAVVCCCRQKSCASHAVVQNILAFFFACVLIAINIMFIRQPNECFFTEGICQKLSWISPLSDSIECLIDGLDSGCGNTRILLIIAQLAAGVLLAMTCLIYLVTYAIVIQRISSASGTQRTGTTESLMSPIYQSNQQRLPLGMNHPHPYTIAAHPYHLAAPMMIPVYAPPLPSDGSYVNYMTPNPYATIHSHIANDRF